MEKTFPLAYVILPRLISYGSPTRHHSYRSLKVTKVNTYALVFHWQGTDPSLKPILITAHQGQSSRGVHSLQHRP